MVHKRAQDLDSIFDALSHETRRQILLLLRKSGGAMSSGDIAAKYDLAWPTISRHLKVLKDANLVTITRKAQSLEYELNGDTFHEIWKTWFSHFLKQEKL